MSAAMRSSTASCSNLGLLHTCSARKVAEHEQAVVQHAVMVQPSREGALLVDTCFSSDALGPGLFSKGLGSRLVRGVL